MMSGPTSFDTLLPWLNGSTLDNKTEDDPVEGIIIRYQGFYFAKATDDSDKVVPTQICDNCHNQAAREAFPGNLDCDFKYDRKYRVYTPDEMTFSQFHHLFQEDGMWRCPHSSICVAFLAKDPSAYHHSFGAEVHCLWKIDPTCPMDGYLVCFHHKVQAFKEAALKVPGLTQAQKDHISAYTG